MNDLERKNRRVAQYVCATVFLMVALSFASVPLYSLFCKVTGFAGTPQTSGSLPKDISQREITISFDARVDNSLPWTFKPEKHKIVLRIGQQGIMNYRAVNEAEVPTTGTALYNVTPEQAGKYFHKTQCFCFAKQSLGSGKAGDFPVVFYVDPAILKDPEADDITDITLSYTFYAASSDALDNALSAYGGKL